MNYDINLKIPADHATGLVEFYIKKKSYYEAELAVINDVLDQLAGKKEQSEPVLKDLVLPVAIQEYKPHWTNTEKAAFFIRRAGKALTTGEIADDIRSYQPGLDKTGLVAAISSVLGQKVKSANPIFFREKNKDGDYVYTVK